MRKDECPLNRCISSKETEEIITAKAAAKAARYRVRAVALNACNAFIHEGDGDHNGTFDAVFRIHTDDTKETREGTLRRGCGEVAGPGAAAGAPALLSALGECGPL